MINSLSQDTDRLNDFIWGSEDVEPSKPFRVQGSQFFLTYSRCSILKHDLLDKLKSNSSFRMSKSFPILLLEKSMLNMRQIQNLFISIFG